MVIGDETRSNPWLAELQQDVRRNEPRNSLISVRDGDMVWVKHLKVRRSKLKRWSLNVLPQVLRSTIPLRGPYGRKGPKG